MRQPAWLLQALKLSLVAVIVMLTGAAPLPHTADQRFKDLRVVEAAPIYPSICRSLDQQDDPCVGVHVSVVHSCGYKRFCYDAAQYTIDQQILKRLEQDFGDYKWVVLRHIDNAVIELGLPDSEHREEGRLLFQARRRLRRYRYYRLLPDITLSLEVELWVSRLAERYYHQKRRPLVITSGTRTPRSQAWAMYSKLVRGARFIRLYRQKCAAREIKHAYLKARRAGKDSHQIVDSMTDVIKTQIARGTYISAHLRDGAVDIRSRNMTRSMKWALEGAARQFKELKLNREERHPPHYHLEIFADENETKALTDPESTDCPAFDKGVAEK